MGLKVEHKSKSVRGFLWCFWMSLGHSQVRARRGTCGRASLVTLVHMAACFLRFLVLAPSPILSESFLSFLSVVPFAPFWFLSWLLFCEGILAGQSPEFTGARLLQPLHILLWAPCTHLVLTIQWDRISQSFTCPHAGLLCLPVTNLLAILDFFCSQTHYFIWTHPIQLSILLIQLFVVCSHPLEFWVCRDTLSLAKIFHEFMVLLFNCPVFFMGNWGD